MRKLHERYSDTLERVTYALDLVRVDVWLFDGPAIRMVLEVPRV